MFLRLFRSTSRLGSLNIHSRFSQSFSKLDIDKIPPLNEFLKQHQAAPHAHSGEVSAKYLKYSNIQKKANVPKKYFIETYGCQMNENDTEIISSILQKSGMTLTKDISEANVVLLNTCAIRENAESKVWNRLTELRSLKKKVKKEQFIIGVLGCMAERLKEKLVEKNKAVDIVVGPDAYRDLPNLIEAVEADNSDYGINVQLSHEETYADIVPVRTNPDSHSAFLSIMRGCNNMCSFCIVPFTRGRERSRSIESIVEEVQALKDQGVKEITLLGQNVNSYHDVFDQTLHAEHQNSKGFNEMYKLREGTGARFDVLLQKCAEAAPEIRFRFTSPHPKDFPERVIDVIKSYDNICKNIHLPAQSGSTSMLTRMRRNHTREAYLELANGIRSAIPGMTFSTDLICGFCGETDQEFEDTLTLIEHMQYEQAFLFAYSMREKTHAHRNFTDDVPAEVKQERLERMIQTFLKNQLIATQKELNRYHLVLIDGQSKVPGQWKGRTDTNRKAVFNSSGILEKLPDGISDKIRNNTISGNEFTEMINNHKTQASNISEVQKGDYVIVRVDDVSNRTLFCTPVAKSNMTEFFYSTKKNPFFTLN